MSFKGKRPETKAGANPGIDADAVRELAQLLKETGLTEIEIEHNGARIRVSRGSAASAPVSGAPAPAPAAASASSNASSPAVGAVPSPMVGTVYLAPEPGRPAFISLGKTVKENDTLFIVEAMKTMNAITAPKGGTVTEICVADGSPVEYGQILCVIV
jgi:acetyl-CoA carboxylase biotin carboxyl carrier protein